MIFVCDAVKFGQFLCDGVVFFLSVATGREMCVGGEVGGGVNSVLMLGEVGAGRGYFCVNDCDFVLKVAPLVVLGAGFLSSSMTLSKFFVTGFW